jgi:Chaperone of endosialidase
MKPNIPPVLIIFALVCFSLVQNIQAVSPPPDGGYPGLNTAEGQNALLSLTSGVYNTAVGFSSLKSNTTGNANTAIGLNALSSNTTGYNNTANGVNALYSNTTGYENTANGVAALFRNTTGVGNTATGASALVFNTSGNDNTAVGAYALLENSANGNTGVGSGALASSRGDGNTAVGNGALWRNFSGSLNTALGQNAGQWLQGGDSNNIDIGANVGGVSGESNTIRIGNTDITNTFISGISGTTVASGAPVLVDSNGHLGTLTSSKRFKEEIRPMNKTSEAIFSLEPVTFRYNKEIDPAGTSQFGLVAEDVERINPDLVVRDKNGEIYTVRYEAVNAMLLNEFLKEHRKNDEQQATIAQLKSGMEALTATMKEQAAQIQKVNAQLEASKPTPQMVANEQ